MTAPAAVEVSDQTRSGSSRRLAEEITATLHEAAPLIRHYAHLPIPALRVALLAPRAWQAAAVDDMVRRLAQDDQPATAQTRKAAQESLLAWRRTIRGWRTIPALTYLSADNSPVTVLAPDALRAQGYLRTPQALRRLIRHEAVHQAQFTYSQGQVAPPPVVGSEAGWRTVRLLEGHATWVEEAITREIEGRLPAGALPVARSALAVREAHQFCSQRFGRRSRPKKEPFRRALGRIALGECLPYVPSWTTEEQFVAATLPVLGPAWSAVLDSRAAVPTDGEFRRPRQWLDRLAAAGSPVPLLPEDR